MSISSFSISLDMHVMNPQICLHAKKGDTGRTINVTILENGSILKLTNYTANLKAVKGDGNPVVIEGLTILNDTIIYDFEDQFVSSSGIMLCEIQVFDISGKLVTSPTFHISFDSSVSDAAESTPYVSTLRQSFGELIEEWEETTQNYESAISNANAAARNASDAALAAATINNTLQTKLEAGEFNGITPHIGENGNWWIGEEDTGVLANKPVYIIPWLNMGTATEEEKQENKEILQTINSLEVGAYSLYLKDSSSYIPLSEKRGGVYIFRSHNSHLLPIYEVYLSPDTYTQHFYFEGTNTLDPYDVDKIPTSSAVANYVTEEIDKIENVNGQYELLKTVTTTSIVNSVTIDEDDNGEAFECKEVQLVCRVIGDEALTADEYTGIYFRAFSGATTKTVLVIGEAITDVYKVAVCVVKNNKGLWESTGACGANNSPRLMYQGYATEPYAGNETISKVACAKHGSVKIPAGTTFELWGVRA